MTALPSYENTLIDQAALSEQGRAFIACARSARTKTDRFVMKQKAMTHIMQMQQSGFSTADLEEEFDRLETPFFQDLSRHIKIGQSYLSARMPLKAANAPWTAPCRDRPRLHDIFAMIALAGMIALIIALIPHAIVRELDWRHDRLCRHYAAEVNSYALKQGQEPPCQ